MILTRNEIAKLIADEQIAFEPGLDAYQDQPHAVDLRLGQTFYIPRMWKCTEKGREVLTVDVTETAGDNFDQINLNPGQYFDLAPGESIIASTLEKITLKSPDIMGILYPRSSVNRRGLSVDLTGIIDAHYSGHLMIPILNKTAHQIIRLYPGERVCQVVLQKLTSDISYTDAQRHGVVGAKYQSSDQNELGSKIDDSFENHCIRKGYLDRLKSQKY